MTRSKNNLPSRRASNATASGAEIDAVNLVPGDIVRLRLGDIIPADVRLIEGDYLSVDQSALTGESLPVDKKAGDIAYSSSVAKQGEMVALVTATGANTYLRQDGQTGLDAPNRFRIFKRRF